MGGVTIDGRVAGPAPTPAPAPAPARRRWLLVVLVVAWALAVGGAALWSSAHDRPTAREQTTVAQALPTIDTAIADVVTAAGTTQTVVALTGYELLDASCRVTSARSGSRYERAALIFTAPGTEPALLDRIAAGLPASYRPRVRHGGSPLNHTMSADAGSFVSVRGSVPSAGTVRVAADTGCRTQDRPVSEAEPAGTEPTATAANRASVQAVFTVLGVAPSDWRVHRVPCRGGGTLWTVEASGGPGSAPASLPRALAQTAAVVSRADLYAYHNGLVGVAVRATDGALDVTATTGCA